MAQLALGVVGAVISTYAGVGPGVGFAIGSAIGAVAFAPEQDIPRVGDMKAPAVQYGTELRRLYGSNRTAGSLAWYSPKRVIAGDGGGKGSPEAATGDTSEIDVYYILGIDSPVNAITRVWVNGELKWTQHIQSDAASLAASDGTESWDAIRFLDGNAAQLPDPVIEAIEGVGNAPAYRHRQGVLIDSLKLGQSGQMPLVEFEVIYGAQSLVQSDGLLCHFDAMDGAQVESAIGPNLNIVGSAALTADPKWGDNGGDMDSFGDYFETVSATGTIPGRNWRADCWFKPTSLNGQDLFTIHSSTTNDHVTVGTTPLFTAMYYNIATDLTTGGGGLGSPDDRPTIGAWSHIAVQYNTLTQRLSFFLNGQLTGDAPSGPGVYFSGTAEFDTIYIGNDQPGVVDEFYLRYDIPEAEMYADVYQVPTGPYEASEPTVWTPEPADLADIVIAEWERVDDASKIDASALVGIEVKGFQTSGSVRGAYEALAAVYHFGAVCSDKLYFRLQGGASVATIPFDDLAAGEDKAGDEPFSPERANDEEIAESLALTYPNHSDDYASGTETGSRGGPNKIVVAMQSNVVMTPAEAKECAEVLAALAAISSTSGQISLTDYYAELEPTDPITVPDQDGNLYRMRIVRETLGRGVRALDLVRDDAFTLSGTGITSEDYQPGYTVATPQETVWLLMDTPILRDVDDDPGFYAVAKGSSRGAVLYSSLDDVTYAEEVSIPSEAVFGVCTTIMPDWNGLTVFDETSLLTVSVDAALSSSTRDAMLADETINACAIGSDGRWELGQFRTATLLSAGVYTLSGWLRGRRGTEWAAVDHVVNDTFVMVEDVGVRRVSKQTSEIGAEEFYKAVSVGRLLSSATGEEFTNDAVGLKPYSPVDIRFSVNPFSGAVLLTWKRRTRRSTNFTGSSGSTVPLGEASESYAVSIFSDAGYTVLERNIESATQSYTYSIADRLADLGSSTSTFYVSVAQVSSVVGSGYASHRTVGGGYMSAVSAPAGGLSPVLFAASGSGWLAFSTETITSGISGINSDVLVSSFWSSPSINGPYALVREVNTSLLDGSFVPDFTPTLGRIAQNGTYVLTLGFRRALLDLSADPAYVSPSIDFDEPRILIGDATRFLLFGDTNLVHSSNDGATWTLLGTMAGATFPHAIGDNDYLTHGITKIGSRFFLSFGIEGGAGAVTDRLFYTDHVDARTGWTAVSGLTLGSGEFMHEEVVYDGAVHYAASTEFAVGKTTVYVSSDGGVTWSEEDVFDSATGFEQTTSGTNAAFISQFQVTGTTGSDYVRAYMVNGVVFEKLVGTTTWSAKASGLKNPGYGIVLSGDMSYTDNGQIYTAEGRQVVYETVGVFAAVSGF